MGDRYLGIIFGNIKMMLLSRDFLSSEPKEVVPACRHTAFTQRGGRQKGHNRKYRYAHGDIEAIVCARAGWMMQDRYGNVYPDGIRIRCLSTGWTQMANFGDMMCVQGRMQDKTVWEGASLVCVDPRA